MREGLILPVEKKRFFCCSSDDKEKTKQKKRKKKQKMFTVFKLLHKTLLKLHVASIPPQKHSLSEYFLCQGNCNFASELFEKRKKTSQ